MKEMYKLKYHLEPVSGWMNDPNGLVEKDGKYHIYYQYSYEPEGGLKYWKQFTTKDFLHYQDEGLPSLLIILMIRVVLILGAASMTMDYYVISILVM